jgi:hypothetical protein
MKTSMGRTDKVYRGKQKSTNNFQGEAGVDGETFGDTRVS